MVDLTQLREDMEIIGADGAHIGTIDKVEGKRIKLRRTDSGSHKSHHHYLSTGLVAGVEGDKVRLSANGDAAVLLEEEKSGEAIADRRLWNWTSVGIGAAAVGVVAAVAASVGLRQRGTQRAKGKKDD
jgi:hypothetical protein